MKAKSGQQWTTDIQPPVAKQRIKYREIEGRKWQDEYSWLENSDNPEVKAYIDAENAYTVAVMRNSEPMRTRIYDELKSRIQPFDETVSVEIGRYLYFSREQAELQYAAHYRKTANGQGEIELLLDENVLARNEEYFDLGVLEISENPNYLAYSVDTSGAEYFELYIKELSTGKLIDTVIPDTTDELVWSNRGDDIYYLKVNESGRPYKVCRHKLFTAIDLDESIFEESDPAFSLSIWKSRSKRFIFIESHSGSASEVWYLELGILSAPPVLIQRREKNLEYTVDHHGERFLIVTDDGVNNSKLMYAPLGNPSRMNWRDLYTAHSHISVESVEPFENQLVVVEQTNGQYSLRVFDLKKKIEYVVEMPQTENVVEIGQNPNYQDRKLRYRYSSLVCPDRIYEYDLESRQQVLLKQQLIPEQENLSDYISKRVYASGSDGKMIPISLAYNNRKIKPGGNPVYLEGYGAYGESLDAEFDIDLVSLLNRGIIYAQAHVRGGGEMGKAWHDEGKLLNKKQSFKDFICCAEQLIELGLARRKQIVAYGASAGGLLVAASVGLRPDLFAAAICEVPFVDVLNTMANPELPLTVQDYDEIGNPANPEFFDYIMSYSPYETIGHGEHPPLLVTAGLNDTRVPYWEALKWVAKLRLYKVNKTPLCLKVEQDNGHLGGSGRFESCKETALIYDFVLSALNLGNPAVDTEGGLR